MTFCQREGKGKALEWMRGGIQSEVGCRNFSEPGLDHKRGFGDGLLFSSDYLLNFSLNEPMDEFG